MSITFSFSVSRVFRVALGLLFIALGYNYFIQFLPQKTFDIPSRYILGFLGVYEISHYLMVLTEILCGILLIINVAVPLSLILLFPIIINLTAYHIEISQNLATVFMITSIYFALFAANIKNFSFLLQGNKE